MNASTNHAGSVSQTFHITEHEAPRGARYYVAWRADDPVPLGVFGSYAEACRHCERQQELLAA